MNKSAAEQILKKFESMRILIIGDVMIDSYMWGKVERISPEAPIPVVSVTNTENRLGGAGNVALNIKSLGASAFLCSIIGNDKNKDVFIDLLHKNAISPDYIFASDKRKTTIKTRVISDGQHLLRVDEEVTFEIDSETEEKFALLIKKTLDTVKPDAIILQDYDKGIFTKILIESITSEANTKNIPVTVDPKKRHFADFKNVSLFKPNLKELKEGTKTEIEKHDIEKILSCANSFRKEKNISILMTTLSEAGVIICNNTDTYHIPAKLRNITDVSGAGDTVISVATLCLAAGLNIKDIAAISNIAGGLVCEKVGVAVVEKEKLLEELAQEKN